eukprot:1156504-Pelagomonas_calceolata.AAC.11
MDMRHTVTSGHKARMSYQGIAALYACQHECIAALFACQHECLIKAKLPCMLASTNVFLRHSCLIGLPARSPSATAARGSQQKAGRPNALLVCSAHLCHDLSFCCTRNAVPCNPAAAAACGSQQGRRPNTPSMCTACLCVMTSACCTRSTVKSN